MIYKIHESLRGRCVHSLIVKGINVMKHHVVSEVKTEPKNWNFNIYFQFYWFSTFY